MPHKTIKATKAWAVLLPGTNRMTSNEIVFCPDGKDFDFCVKYDLYERKAAAQIAAAIYPEVHRQVIPVLITPIPQKKKKGKI